jgi:hypothetical protein
MWTRKILDNFKKIDMKLARRLGEANWIRFQRISQKLEAIELMGELSEDEDSEYEQEEPENVGTSTVTESLQEDSIFSTPKRQGTDRVTTTATSISHPKLDYRFPLARRRVLARDVRSQMTYTSVMTDDRGERGWFRVPPLPVSPANLGSPFRCTVCGEKLHDIMNRTDWK